MTFLIFIGGIVVLILVLNLRGRVRVLEQIEKSGSVKQQTPAPNYQSQTTQTEISPFPPQSSRDATIPLPTKPVAPDKFTEWLKEDWLLKFGALFLLIGFGWLATYAFLNNWIGPMGRIVLGILAGTAFLILGWVRIKKYLHQGGVFLVLGSTTILLTIFAAREIYDFFTPLFALIVMFLSAAFVALASVKYNNRALSLASLIAAGVAPLLTNSPTPDYIGLYSYLFIVVLGTIWIVALTGQRILVAAALVLITFYSLPHLTSFTLADKEVLLLFAYAFAAVFFLTNTAGILKHKDKDIVPDLVTAAGNGLLLLVWIMSAAQDEWKSLIISAWMIVFSVGAFLIFKITRKQEPFYIYAGIGIAMLAAATSAELQGAALTIAYTIESGIVTFIAYAILQNIKIAERTSLILVGPVILSVGSVLSNRWTASVIHKDFFVLLILGLTLFGLGIFFQQLAKNTETKKSQQLSAILLIAGSIYAYMLLWLSLHAGLQYNTVEYNTATMFSLVIYTVVGLAFYFYGIANGKRGLRFYGDALIGFVIGRLLLVEVWEMELATKIITFFLIGALLVSTAFFKKKDAILTDNM
jgi:uncharacterized membrane protein